MDQSFNRATLARCLNSNDFFQDQNLTDDEYRHSLITKSIEIAQNSDKFTPILSIGNSSKKTIYSVNSLPEKLVLRKCAKNVRRATKIRLKSRSQIIKEIKVFLREGTLYRIYRLDISSFFESCDYERILEILPKYRVSTQTQVLLRSFLESFNSNYSSGLPRGVEVSPILAELCLTDLDLTISSMKHVFYYSRFVDDIFIITSCNEDKKEFLKKVRKSLPAGLILNHNKTRSFDIPARSTGMSPMPDPTLYSFDYLGYKISIVDTDLSKINPNKPAPLKKTQYRRIDVDLTARKVSKIKSKIIKSFYSFTKDSDYELLKDRLVFLSSNRDMLNKIKNRKIPTGIYYNHPEIDNPSPALKELDIFLKTLITNPRGRIESILVGKLNNIHKKNLLKISFQEGFKKRIFKKYSPNRLRAIARIW